MISVQGLDKSYNNLQVLKSIDLQIASGKITAILGPNGSGKTTLIKSLLGMVIPDRGSIYVNGNNVQKEWRYRNKISYLPQIAKFPENLTVNELIDLIKDLRQDHVNQTELIDFFDLREFLNKRLRNLSGGTRQKVNVVLAYMYDCPLIIMDEPTAGLDPVALIRLKELIEKERQRGKTILFTTHIMSLVEEIAEEIIFILEGKIHFNGTMDEMKSTYKASSLEHSIAIILREND